MNRWTRNLLPVLLLFSATSPAAAPDIVIVKSSDNSYFNETIETLINHVDQEARFRVVGSDDLESLDNDAAHDRYYIALGFAATEAVGRLAGEAPVFNAYLTEEQYRQLQPRGQHSIVLDQPLYRYLAFSKLLLDLDSIGMLETESDEPVKAETRVLDELDFSLNRYRINAHNKLLPVLRRLLQQNDALLMLPHSKIYNRDTLKGVLLTSYRFRKPVISYSPAHVRAGALASIYSSPTDIGRHLALVVNHRLQQPQANTPVYEYARFYSITTNSRVARALNLTLPPASEIRRQLENIAP